MSAPVPVRVRRARPEDWSVVRALLAEIDHLHAAFAPEYFRASARAEADWRQLLSDPSAAALVATIVEGRSARSDGQEVPAGFVGLRVYDTPTDPTLVPRRRAHVETLVVTERHRRCGVGARLLADAADWARTCGAVELVLTIWEGNTGADAFYARLGYGVLSRVLHKPL